MSTELTNDKKVVEDGRKAPLKDVDAPLRDQVVAKLYKKLQEDKIADRAVSIWTKGNYNRDLWLERQKAYLSSWDEHLVQGNEGAFEGSSQLHIPMPFVVCKTMHARYLQALWQDPPFNVRAQNEASMDRVATVRDTMRYYLMKGANYNKGAGKVVDAWVWDWITQGSGVMKLRWDVQYTRLIDVQNVPKKVSSVKLVDGKEAVVDTVVMEEKEVQTTKKTYEGPVFDLVDVEDFLTIGGNGDPDLADAVVHRQYLSASELWTLSDRKIFDADAVETVISGGPDKQSGAIGNEMKVQRANNAGKSMLETDRDLERYEILECYLKVDVDGSGINADVVVWVHKRTRELLRATYLHRISKSGERPFIKADFQPRKGQEFGAGMVELLYPLSKEMDAIHNMRIDWGMISVMPFGFYRPSSGIDPEVIQFEPGALIPVDNPATDVFFPNLGNRTVFGMQEEQAIQGMVERITSISDLNLGLMNGQGATRTATGARALVGEMSANLDVYLRRLNFGWEKALRCLLHTIQQRIPKGLSFRLTGDDGQDYWRQIRDADDLSGDYDIEVSPNSSSSNASIQQDQAQQIFQMVCNPLLIQMGAIGPGQVYEAAKNVMQSMGVKDWGKYLQKPQGYSYTPSPEAEANEILRGVDVPVTPNMDHQGFIDYFQHIHDTDELAGQFPTDRFVALAQQAQKHQQMLQALKAQQAQQANVAQMQRNAQAGATMAPGQGGPMMSGAGGAPNGQGPAQ